jgi:hypothetical protein
MNDSRTNEPMILVKKPDGTSVRVPLSSLKKEPKMVTDTVVNSISTQSQTSPPPVVVPEPVGVSPVVEPQKIDSKISAQSLLAESYSDDVPVESPTVVTSPVVMSTVSQPVPVVPKRQWSVDDHRSPLMEEVSVEHGAHDTTLIRGDQQIAAFLVAHPGMVVAELQGRAVSLLSSFVKGVRSRDQVLQYAMKPMLSGGLELSEQGAQTLIQEIETYFNINTVSHVSRQTRPAPVVATPAPRPKPIEPPLYVPAPPQVSSVTARPVMTDIVQVTPEELSQQARVVPSGGGVAQTYPVTLTPQSVIRSPQHQTVGPVEEMQSFTREDFRRLSTEPESAADVLLQKIENISKESPLLGLSVCRAWFQSALYKEYLLTLSQSFARGQTIEQISTGVQSLSREEIIALLKINRACEEA